MAPVRGPELTTSRVDDPDPSEGLDPLGPLRPPLSVGIGDRLSGWVADRGWSVVVDRRRVGAGVLVVAALLAAGWWLLRPAPAPVERVLPLAGRTEAAAEPAAGGGAAGDAGGSAGSATSTSTTSAVADLVVQAAGSVVRPGVYRLAPGSRVDDLVTAAGGFGPGADPDRVNLAAPLADGVRVWVPAVGQDPPVVVAGGGAGGTGGSTASSSSSSSGPDAGAPAAPVDLNTATAEELDGLPGVGPATASAILSYREEHGPFAAVDDLLDVRGIGEAKLEQLRPLVTV